jgi:flagellar hook assembly protein FlgD
VRVVIYDLLGRVVRVLVDGTLSPGRHLAVWDGRDAHGHAMDSGTYLCRLTAGSATRTIKMALVK